MICILMITTIGESSKTAQLLTEADEMLFEEEERRKKKKEDRVITFFASANRDLRIELCQQRVGLHKHQ